MNRIVSTSGRYNTTVGSKKYHRGRSGPHLSTFNIRAQVVSDLRQDKVDVVLSWDGVRCHFGGAIRGSRNGHFLPGQEEDDAAVARGGVKKTHVVRAGEQRFLLSWRNPTGGEERATGKPDMRGRGGAEGGQVAGRRKMRKEENEVAGISVQRAAAPPGLTQ